MLNCGPGQTCCGTCAATKIAPPVNLGELGFWAELASVAAKAIAVAPKVAETAAVVSSVKNSAVQYTNSKYPPGLTSKEIAAQLVAENQTPANLLKSPAVLIGAGAVALALILRKK